MISNNRNNWLNSINWQVDFYQRSNQRCRIDPEFPWTLVGHEIMPPPIQIARDIVKCALHNFGLRRNKTGLEWLNNNAEALWESRSLLDDELSKILFDATLVLRLAGHRKFYFPRMEFEDLIEITNEKPFQNSELPGDYIGLPLKLFDIQFREYSNAIPMKMVVYKEFFSLLNSYRQYLIRRNSIDISPVPGDIVLDCGACIGDMSLIFAGLVAMKGEVHLFDPIPLHTRYCQLQASLNPSLAHIFHINELAVSNRTYVTNGNKSDLDKITPGCSSIDSFSSTSLDDYVSSKRLSRVDFIKMDIEGYEMDAIEGATKIIQEFKPRLAISVYHKPDDFWKIPIKLKTLNPSYKLYFGHHSPVNAESVFYAI